ncbi:MAG: alpha/beta hydrolase, partial [Candidatus Heimdallarchaeota archaeon]|nr:alpha/beta hydrolase [Candidatus Heimdallarchaeota archaeon]MCK4876137.1 alpha/beta hydrolase [Candidatus Heimdallarchaeota archaeon]
PYHGVDSALLCSVKTADEFYDWGKDYIEKLKRKYQTVIGLGISLGGGTIFDYLVNKGGNLDAAIMLGTGGFAAKELGLLVWLVCIFNLKAIRNPFINEFDKTLVPLEYFNWKMENFPKVPVKMLMKALYKQKKEGISEKLGRINCPTMLVNGTSGLLTNRKSVAQYFEIIPAKKKYGLIVEGATHTVHKSQFNKQILDHIIKFISEIIESKTTEKEIEGQTIIILDDEYYSS